jgi:hypothetical protein
VWLTIQHHPKDRKESVVAELEESGKSCFHLGGERPTFLLKDAQPCVKSRVRLSDF